jgi:hypothetical protein
MSYKFPAQIRPFVQSLADLMYYANSREDGKWANQSENRDYDGVFGAAMTTVRYIVRELFGDAAVEVFKERLEFGCAPSFMDDIEWTIEQCTFRVRLYRHNGEQVKDEVFFAVDEDAAVKSAYYKYMGDPNRVLECDVEWREEDNFVNVGSNMRAEIVR